MVQRKSRDLTEALGGSSLCSGDTLLPSPSPVPLLPLSTALLFHPLCCSRLPPLLQTTSLWSWSCTQPLPASRPSPPLFLSYHQMCCLFHLLVPPPCRLPACYLHPAGSIPPAQGDTGHSRNPAGLSEVGKGCQAEKQRGKQPSQTGGYAFAGFPHVGHWRTCQLSALHDNRRRGEYGLGAKPPPFCQAPTRQALSFVQCAGQGRPPPEM